MSCSVASSDAAYKSARIGHDSRFSSRSEASTFDSTCSTQELAKAIEAIPDGDKISYTKAVSRVPDLVTNESNPEAYIRCEQYNVKAAARRLVNYWTVRCMVFGEDKAFQPMTLSGAMSGDIHLLTKGIMMILPRDQCGRPVVGWNGIQSVSPFHVANCSLYDQSDAVHRFVFYMMHLLSFQNENAQREGYVSVVGIDDVDTHSPVNQRFAQRMYAIRDCMPMKERVMHVCVSGNRKRTDQESTESLVSIIAKAYGESACRGISEYQCTTNFEVYEQLRPYGLDWQHICWSLDNLYEDDSDTSWLFSRRAN